VLGLSAIVAVRTEARVRGDSADFTKAMFCAQSAIEKGRYLIDADPSWRSSRLDGNWEEGTAIGEGTYTLAGYDPVDGILGNRAGDPLVLEGSGFAGDAKYRLRVELQPTGGGLTCLQVPLHAGSSLSFNGATVTSNGPVSSNSSITASGSLVTANAQAVGPISGSVIVGTKTTPITARTMPGPTVFDYYTNPSHATQISMTSLPLDSGDRTIRNATLSATSNPYGAKNAAGLYYIDCGGARLVVRDSRIIATLAVINASEVRLRDNVNWHPSSSAYPSLLVQGELRIEISALNFLLNLNLLPSEIHGLFYAAGDVDLRGNTRIIGVLVGGAQIEVTETLTLTYDPAYLSNPPPGFGTPITMEIMDGTWQRLVD
jgi:hypothetical protein